MLDRIVAFADEQGLPITDEALGRLERYADLLIEFNRRQNLIGTSDPARIEHELLLDSLAAAVVAAPSGTMLDVGTGAGLPGVPLSILFDVETTLVEPRKKRAAFLRIANQRLALGANIVEGRIEDVELPAFDYVISKAFQPPAEWVGTAAGLIAPGGTIIVMHASDAGDALRDAAAEHGLEQVGHLADIGAIGGFEGAATRAISAFRSTAGA